MTWTLFRLALRLTLVASLLLVGALLGLFAVGEYLFETRWRVTSLGSAPDVLTWTFVAWSGFPAGGRLFSREFRERHFLLLQGLPVSRLRSWLSLVLGALTSGLVSVALVCLVRPPDFLWRGEGLIEPGSGAPGLWMLALLPVCLYLFFFGAGACYGLLLGGTVLQPVGMFASLGLLAALLGGLLHLHLFGEAEPLPGPRTALENALAVLVLSSLVYLFLSYRLYARGEFPVARVRWRGLAAALTAHGVLLAAVWGLGTARVRSAPFTSLTGNVIRFDLSPDGRLAAVVEHRRDYPRFARVNVVDVLSSRVRGRAEIDGLLFLEWAPEDESLAVGAARSFPRLTGQEGTGGLQEEGEASLVWVSAAGERLRRVELEHSLVALHRGRDRVLAEVVAEEERVLVDLGAGPGAAPRELATTEASGRWSVRRLPEGADLAIWNPGDRRAGRVLRLGASTEELRVLGQPRSLLDEEIRILGATGFAGDAVLQDLSRRLPPVPGAGSATVQRIIWDELEEPAWAYALVMGEGANEADVLALAPTERTWRPVLEGLPWIRERDHVTAATASSCVSLPPLPHALCSDGIVARPGPDGAGSFTVVDLAHETERRIPGSLRHFRRVSGRVALAVVEAVETTENPVTLPLSGLDVYSVPSGIGYGSWSEAARGLVYEELEARRLLLWTPDSPDSRTIWPISD